MTEQKTCLVVDDSDIIREIAARIAADLGLATEQAENATDAVALCQDKTIDVVLLDWDLPSMGALDFLRGAAELPEDGKPKVILCATENDPQQFTLAKAAGAAHYVLKPFDRNAIEIAFVEAGIIDPGKSEQTTSSTTS